MKIIAFVNFSSKYQDVAKAFLASWKKNFKYTGIRLVVISDNVYKTQDFENFQSNEKSLPKKIYLASKKYPADYYLCLLGDAFICDRVDRTKIKKLVNFIEKNKIDYCNLMPKNMPHKGIIRYINKREAYGVSFIAFISSRKYIETVLSAYTDDIAFEMDYLGKAEKNTPGYYKNMIILNENIFHILHGVIKGKWTRKAARYIERNFPEIILNREKLSALDSLYVVGAHVFQNYFPQSLRKIIKGH